MIIAEEYLSQRFFQIFIQFLAPLVFFLLPPPIPLFIINLNYPRLAVMSLKSLILLIYYLFQVVFIMAYQ